MAPHSHSGAIGVGSGRRRLLIGMGGLAALYAASRALPRLWPQSFDFTPVPGVAGFRRIQGGQVSGGFDPFAGIGSAPDPALDTLTEALRRDPRPALFDGTAPRPGLVPIASFSDYYCPYCRIQTQELARLEREPGGTVQVFWHELPLLGEASQLAARAALAAKRQGAYPAFHQAMMRTRFQATPDYLTALAGRIGIDGPRLIADMDSPEITAALRNSAALARIFGFYGTPAMVVGRTAVQGRLAPDLLRRLIAAETRDG